MDFDKPPSPLMLVLIGVGAVVLLGVGCCCTAIIGPLIIPPDKWQRR